MSDDDAEAFLREVRAALATARPEEPSLDSLQRLMTWLQTTEMEEAPPEVGRDGTEDGEGAAPEVSEP
ncbi:hypothetical protein MKK55_06360 [Methylobacterium sp. J-059]|uniref:hypothetical protein n=1 Tax=unclassified Methylobacterium TaxID=2615210 RepID=UPI0011CAA11A|nr:MULTISPECIES: hypothetical protein [unclassified Methylobacterium]MCJ2038579.1 hypothetical protein [Methylobacterium sp. J-059]TXN61390.1 hypothetical protein FV230_24030 [Methylobacterium sp. WL6]